MVILLLLFGEPVSKSTRRLLEFIVIISKYYLRRRHTEFDYLFFGFVLWGDWVWKVVMPVRALVVMAVGVVVAAVIIRVTVVMAVIFRISVMVVIVVKTGMKVVALTTFYVILCFILLPLF